MTGKSRKRKFGRVDHSLKEWLPFDPIDRPLVDTIKVTHQEKREHISKADTMHFDLKPLSLEIIPTSLFGKNLAKLPHWKAITKRSDAIHGTVCVICGSAKTICHHEVWSFTNPPIAKVEDVIPICMDCHQAKHNRPDIAPPTEAIIAHYLRVNPIATRKSYFELLRYDMKVAEERSKIDWIPDYNGWDKIE